MRKALNPVQTVAYVFVAFALFVIVGIALKFVQLGDMRAWLVLVPFGFALTLWYRNFESAVVLSFRVVSEDTFRIIRTSRMLILADIASLTILLSFFYEGAFPGMSKFAVGGQGIYLTSLAVLAALWFMACFLVGRSAIREHDRLVAIKSVITGDAVKGDGL